MNYTEYQISLVAPVKTCMDLQTLFQLHIDSILLLSFNKSLNQIITTTKFDTQ